MVKTIEQRKTEHGKGHQKQYRITNANSSTYYGGKTPVFKQRNVKEEEKMLR